MSDNLERPNYMGWLPAEVRYSKISASAKLLYVEITSLANKTGTCWASNKYFAELYGVSADSVSRWVSELTKANFIESDVVKEAGNKRYLRLSEKITIPIGKNADTYRQKAVSGLSGATSEPNNIKEDIKTNKVADAQLLALVNKITGRDFRVLPRGSRKTLDTFTLEEIESALTALAHDPWHKPKLKELSSDYLLRATTIDKFKTKAPANGGDAYGFKNGKKIFTEDDDGNQYWGGEKITPQNQDRVLKERNAQ